MLPRPVDIAAGPSRLSALFRSDVIQRVLAFAGLILLYFVFSVKSPVFLSGQNQINILVATGVNGLLALGVTFVIISGGIDLSIGTVMSFGAVMSAVFITDWNQPVVIGVLGGIGAGTLAGLMNGFIIAKLKVPPFIATLGMLNIAKGLALILSGVAPMYYPNAPGFSQIALGTIIPPIPNAVLILFGAALVASLILARTVLGRYTFALGSNEEATRLSGINVDAWKIGIYTLCGAFAGLAGILIAARLNGAFPEQGQGFELNAIAAAVIGGTSLSGGEGTILGTLIGALLLSTLTDGLQILSVPGEWQILVTGVIVVLAVYLDIVRRRAA
ncbi:MAG: ABC transporter permease [Aggregatilineales bacterium]